jgi:repressor LexA
MKKTLTTKQNTILSLISKFASDNNGNTPTLDWLRSQAGYSSINSIVKHLKALEAKGYIMRRKHAKENNIVLLEELEKSVDGTASSMVTIPVIASVGCDDMSVFAEETADEFLTIDASLLGRKRVIAIRAEGDSMNDAGVENGDYALVELMENGEPVQNGEIVTAIIDGMAVLKRYEKKDNMVILYPQSRNPEHKPIIVNQGFRIVGKLWQIIPGLGGFEDVSFEPVPAF